MRDRVFIISRLKQVKAKKPCHTRTSKRPWKTLCPEIRPVQYVQKLLSLQSAFGLNGGTRSSMTPT